MGKLVDIDNLNEGIANANNLSNDEKEAFINIAEQTEPADAEFVTHGRWIRRPDGSICCSACNSVVAMVFGDISYEQEASENHFCYNCGARMDLEEF